MYIWILGICIIIVFIVLALSVITTNKAYKYEHTIDPEDKKEDGKKNSAD
ncbi:YtzI protein [Bacillus mangrovi]|uniref:YtzI protein n=1 Tax=Metabacillus mangrovi TaxID=1491830 RepID=A0A7X2S698_9BACI|nr:YtzI protein [Metabacillus mangrovi]MTH54444.1 YtzI protein [Metabacillus mangrovi]